MGYPACGVTVARLIEPTNAQRRALSSLLREIRESAGLRQTDVAERLGLPQSFVSKYESGERRLDVIELRAVSNALGVPLPQLVAKLEDALASRDEAP